MKISKRSANHAVALLKKITHPDRLLTLCHLTNGRLSAGELASRSNLGLSAFSQHLAILRKGDLITAEREAQTLYYSIKDPAVFKILLTLKELFCPDN